MKTAATSQAFFYGADTCNGLQSKRAGTAISVMYGPTLFAPITLARTAFVAIETAFTQPGLQSTVLGPHSLRLPGTTGEEACPQPFIPSWGGAGRIERGTA
jgi:hypothetical protein